MFRPENECEFYEPDVYDPPSQTREWTAKEITLAVAANAIVIQCLITVCHLIARAELRGLRYLIRLFH